MYIRPLRGATTVLQLFVNVDVCVIFRSRKEMEESVHDISVYYQLNLDLERFRYMLCGAHWVMVWLAGITARTHLSTMPKFSGSCIARSHFCMPSIRPPSSSWLYRVKR